MTLLWAVMRKELLEALGDRHSFQGLLVQGGSVLITTGILVPWFAARSSLWLEAGAMVSLYVLFPAVFASFLAADAVAGELERGTLETLCATPVSDGTLLFGKALTAVVLAVALSYLSQALGLLIVNLHGHRPGLFLPSVRVLVATLGGAPTAALLTTALALGVSCRVHVARAAQQVCVIFNLLLFFVGVEVVTRLPLPSGLTGMFLLEGVTLLAGVVTLILVRARFRRERFFEHR
jgi:ABC-2 type transport system permease protein